MASESVRSRLAFNASAFQQLEEREAASLLAEERARAALQSAQDALDAVRTELQDVRGRRAGVASTIGELRGYLGARLLQSLPAEVLYMIFSEAVDDPYARDDWMYQLPPAAVMPYTLAAVCRRWRHEAVRMARLWSFVVVPSPARPIDEFMGRCLPHCPLLSKIHTDISQLLRPKGYSSLTHLVLQYIELSGITVWELLRGCAGLVHLEIALTLEFADTASPPPFTLDLPALRSLVTRGRSCSLLGAWIDYLRVPQLESLDVQNGNSEGVGNLINHVADSLISLSYCVYTSLDEHDAEQLSVLKNLQRVSLFEPLASFYRYLVDNDAWPKLESLSVSRADTGEEDDRALADFVRTRHERADTVSLKSVVLEDFTESNWLTDTLAFYTSAASESKASRTIPS
ncbi:hypothetical protein AURDEDRAFT_128363 [Auricularia subglabra TFB-10046 SS5]|nr:hypothetical protein AURDEDRAFT_128363 [Auricularia subglabra TFB-10046 SS5]